MDDDENLDERGALIVGPEMPRRGRFTLLVSESFSVEVTEAEDA